VDLLPLFGQNVTREERMAIMIKDGNDDGRNGDAV
jgi:hypothetical protein